MVFSDWVLYCYPLTLHHRPHYLGNYWDWCSAAHYSGVLSIKVYYAMGLVLLLLDICFTISHQALEFWSLFSLSVMYLLLLARTAFCIKLLGNLYEAHPLLKASSLAFISQNWVCYSWRTVRSYFDRSFWAIPLNLASQDTPFLQKRHISINKR